MKMYHYWRASDGKYFGLCMTSEDDVSTGGRFVHKKVEIDVPEFPDLPKPELPDGIYKVKRDGDMDGEFVYRCKMGRGSYSLDGEWLINWEAGGYTVISRLLEQKIDEDKT